MRTRQHKYLDYLFDSNQQSLLDEESLVDLLPEEKADFKAAAKAKLEALRESEQEKKQAIEDTYLLAKQSSLHTAIYDADKTAIEHALAQVEKEMSDKSLYDLVEINDIDGDETAYYTTINHHHIPSPRWRFLKKRKEQLLKLKSKLDKTIKPEPPKPQPTLFVRFVKKFIEYFDNSKKLVDGVDDIVSATGRIPSVPTELVNTIAPVLNGSFGMVVQGTEAGRGLYTAIKNLKKKNPHELRDGKVTANFFIFGAGTIGFAICVTYLVAASGVVIAGSSILNIMIPAMIGIIATIGLVHNIYRYRIATAATQALIDAEKEMNQYKDDLQQLKSDIESKTEKCDQLREQLKNSKDVESITSLTTQIADLNEQIMTAQFEQIRLENKLAKHQSKLDFWMHKRSSAVRNMTFRSIEMIAAAVIIVGLILGTAAIIGAASAATFGAAMIPSAIIFTGVGIGLALKIFEHFDKKYGYKTTNFVLNTLKNAFASLFGRKPTPDLVSPPKDKHELGIEMDTMHRKPAQYNRKANDYARDQSSDNSHTKFFRSPKSPEDKQVVKSSYPLPTLTAVEEN